MEHKKIPVQLGTDVRAIQPSDKGFTLETSNGPLHTRFVVWAAGEFQYPNVNPFPGAEHCLHNSLIDDWGDLEGDEILIIGGYESGIDAAIHLSRLGKKVKILDRKHRWNDTDPVDPSLILSPYTRERFTTALNTGKVDFVAELNVHSVDKMNGKYVIYGERAEGTVRRFSSRVPPILATGFVGSLTLVPTLFEQTSNGHVQLNEHDESTVTPGLFLAGPNVTHDGIMFCFIYKFRQRFAVVARAMADRLGLDTSPLEQYRMQGMLLDDLSCCEETCEC